MKEPSGLECGSRWAAYCTFNALAPIAGLAWYLDPSPLLALAVAVLSSLGLAYSLGVGEGLAWSPFAALALVLDALRHPTLAATTLIVGAAVVLALSRRPLALGLASMAAGLLASNHWAALSVALASLSGVALEAGVIHAFSILAGAPLLFAAGEAWGLLGASAVYAAASALGAPLGSSRCPFRLERGLLAYGVAFTAASLVAAVIGVSGVRVEDIVEASWLFGFTLEESAILVPRGLGALLGEAQPQGAPRPMGEPAVEEAPQA
ncbi:MAG: hypothetical protein GSR80_000077 [Desulfurococcales archaeon]|nr:hypothetical protein [Desulfurococcales archaeon]